MRTAWRILVVIPFAYVAACFAAGLLVILSAGVEPNAGEPVGDFVAKLVVISFVAAIFVGAIAAIPAIVTIVLSEVLGWRSYLLYLVVGAGVGFLAFAMGIGGEAPEGEQHLALGGAAGAVAGFVYWLIAGRRAGRDAPAVTGAPAQGPEL